MSKPEHQHISPETHRQQMLLEFLRQYDADCPVCGYNVKALTQPYCPECNHELTLTVSAARPTIGWLLAAVAPGFFSGIAATFLLIPILMRRFYGDGKWSITLNTLDLFGWCSGCVAIALVVHSRRFLAQRRSRQRSIALLIWLTHVAALAALILIGPRFI
jgi:hypothetical protein